MKKHLFIILLFVYLASCSSESRLWKSTRQDFLETTDKMRPNPLWFWNDSEVKKDELLEQMTEFKKDGYGGLSILPFGREFKPEYLSDEYFNTYKACIEKAHETGMRLWVYDEYGFPSGTAGDINGDGFGRFKHKYPEHTNKRLDKTEYIPKPKTIFEEKLPEEFIMAIVAMDTISYERIDLKDNISSGSVTWDVPEGHWKIMIFTCVNDGNSIVDYMSPQAVKLYIGMTHDEYYKRFAEYFGETIVGTFFDEPTLYYAQGRSWTPGFNNKFEQKYGFSPVLYYPALWYDIGESTEEARNYLFGFRAELYAEGYTKQVNDWSRKHGILATGHQDNEEIINTVGTSGDLMKCFKFLDVPGIDKIGGNRPAERFYKIISSAAYNWDHSLVMSETYGAMGNISWNTIFGIAMDQYVKGINLLIPHAVWYNTDKVVFLPELSGRNPIYADSLNIFNDYLTRLNTIMQNDARWVGDIAILYPINTMQSQHYLDGPEGAYKGGVIIPDLDYVDVSTTIFDELGYDFMFLHPEVLDEQCRIVDKKLTLENKVQYNSFSMLIVPGSKTISLSNLKIIRDFAEAGGSVVFTTAIPSKATVRSHDEDIQSIMQDLLTKENVFFVENPTRESIKNIFDKKQEDFSLRFTGKESLKNIHKFHNNKNLWFFANSDNKRKTVNIELCGEFDLELWNPHTACIEKLDVKQENGKTRFSLTLEAINSVFVIEK